MQRINIGNKILNFEVKESNVAKNIRLELLAEDFLRMIIPIHLNKNNIVEKSLLKYEVWILKKIQKLENINILKPKTHTTEEIKGFKNRVHQLVKQYLEELNLSVNKVYFRSQKTKLGSCSSKGNLSFNIKLIDYPKYVQEYIVVHEVSHLKYLNHSRDFKLYVNNIYPKTKKALKWLRDNKVRD